MSKSRVPVTVIGLGPMGQAMVRRFLGNGHPTTAWNRTASRADDLVAEGAVRAATVADAVAANELVILSLTDYQAMYDILCTAGDALTGRVVVNLSSDTPGTTREAAKWLAERGAELVVGGIMVPAELVGKDAAYVFYSGPRAVFDAHQLTLRVIGRPDYRGEDHALAQLYYQAQLDIFLTSLSAFLHATALVGAAGVLAETFRPYAAGLFDTMSSYLTRSRPGDRRRPLSGRPRQRHHDGSHRRSHCRRQHGCRHRRLPAQRGRLPGRPLTSESRARAASGRRILALRR